MKNQPEYMDSLKRVAPAIAFSVSREIDENFQWDGDGPDPIEEGFYPCDVTVSARAVVNGENFKGCAYLGGSYFKHGESCGEVGGYLPQMLEEAAQDLEKQCAAVGAVDTVIQAQNASNFLCRLMRDRYDDQRAVMAKP